MSIIDSDFGVHFESYKSNKIVLPLLLHGDAITVLKQLPDNSIDCCMTSPPYWSKREYEEGGIGLESDYQRQKGKKGGWL